MTEIITTITPSPARRGIAVFFLVSLGGLLIYLALSAPPQSFFWQAFLIAIGAGALYLGDFLRRATLYSIHLLDDRVVDTAGRELCRLDNIQAVERGAFAFKPSNGFLIRLKKPLPRTWAPGLWWRFGRKVGVGGVTPASQAKFMSEMIALKLSGALSDVT